MTAIDQAKRRLPLPALLARLGKGECAKKSARCPFHDDGHNSFSIWQKGAGMWFWKCHAGCGSGDEITFLEKHYGISNNEAIQRFKELAGAPRSGVVASRTKSPTRRATDELRGKFPRCVARLRNRV